MSTFCRHNRFEHLCPICSRRRPAVAGQAAAASRPSPRRGSASAVKVSRAERATDDGFASTLVAGLHASADAASLADEIGFAAGRLAVLAVSPPGLYAEIAAEPDREEALWLAAQVALSGPLDGAGDPFVGVRAARVPWAGGEPPRLDEPGVEFGPRGALGDAATGRRTFAAYRAWARRAGSQEAALSGDGAWTPERRFARAFERLGSLPGVTRGARYDLLVTLGRLSIADVRADALHVGDRDDTSLAARRAFGIADKVLLDRRAAELAAECDVPIEALDLALANFAATGGRMAQGVAPDVSDPEARARVAAVLGID